MKVFEGIWRKGGEVQFILHFFINSQILDLFTAFANFFNLKNPSFIFQKFGSYCLTEPGMCYYLILGKFSRCNINFIFLSSSSIWHTTFFGQNCGTLYCSKY